MGDPMGSAAIIVVEDPRPASGTGGGIAARTGTATTSMTSGSLTASGGREYRKGNWTIHETMVLITAKKMDDERRMKGGERERNKTAELRWKWVENYCWANGCMRSQNQCNDKWDNLLRDYKKVREYENRPIAGRMTYWQMEKHDRKERNLPSNLTSEVFEALHEVVNRKHQPRLGVPPPAYQHQQPHPTLPLPPPPPPLPPPPPPPSQPPISAEEMTDSSETEGSSDLRRRKVKSLESSILHTASVLSGTLLACEEKKDKRHRAFLNMEERKLQMEESRTEMNRQGLAGLISAVNNLSSAIHAIVSERNSEA